MGSTMVYCEPLKVKLLGTLALNVAVPPTILNAKSVGVRLPVAEAVLKVVSSN